MEFRTFAPTIKGILATSLLLATTGTTLLAQPGKLAPDLADLDPNESIDVIIQLEDSPAPRSGAPRPARPLALGGINLAAQRPVRDLGLINGLSARLPGASLASLASDPRVKYISPDRPVSASLEFATPAVFADVAHRSGFTGAGIGIAVIDSGIAGHRDLRDPACAASRLRYSESFVLNESIGTPTFYEKNKTYDFFMVTALMWPVSSAAGGRIATLRGSTIANSSELLRKPTSSICACSIKMARGPIPASSAPSTVPSN